MSKALFILISCLFLPFDLSARTQLKNDSTFEFKIDSTWQSIKKEFKNKQKHPQFSRIAEDYLEYYVRNSNTEIGQKALQTAISIWGCLGDIKSVERALPSIKVDSDVWPSLLNMISMIYSMQNRLNDYFLKVDTLSTKITNPTGLAEIYFMLIARYPENSNDSLVRQYLHKILLLKADSNQILRANQTLYDMDSLAVGMPAPQFRIKSIQGESIDLSKLKGNIVLLDFTATWCPYCAAELPYLKDAFSKYSKKVSFVSISRDDSASTVANYCKNNQATWPHALITTAGWDTSTVIRKYNAYAQPRILIIDASGKIAAKGLRKDKIETAIKLALERQL